MKPPAFKYFEPTTLDEALALLERWGAWACVLAGGQSLLPLLNRREVHPEAIIDINQLAGLDDIRKEGDALVIGALARHYAVAESPLVQQVAPLMAEAAAAIGSVAIRTRGTIGGSLAYADPAAELPLALVSLGGSVVLASPSGRREVAAEDWLRAPFTTDIAPGELLVETRIPRPSTQAGMALEEISRGFGRPALAAAACLITPNGQGHVADARIAVCGAGAAPRRLPSCERALVGIAPTDDVIAQMAQQAVEAIPFASDVHASASLRRRLATEAMRRALTRAYAWRAW